MIFDTHAHYDDEQFDIDRDELLASMKANGIGHIVNVGANIKSTRGALELAHKYDFIYAAVGVHPSDVEELNEDSFELLRNGARMAGVLQSVRLALITTGTTIRGTSRRFGSEIRSILPKNSEPSTARICHIFIQEAKTVIII